MSQNRLGVYRPGLPPAADGVGGPAGSEEAAKRRTEAIRPVGPTLTRFRNYIGDLVSRRLHGFNGLKSA